MLWKKEMRDLMERLKERGMAGDGADEVKIGEMDMVRATAVLYGCKGQDFVKDGFEVGDLIELKLSTGKVHPSPFYLPVVGGKWERDEGGRSSWDGEIYGLEEDTVGLVLRVGVQNSKSHFPEENPFPSQQKFVEHGATSFLDVLLGEKELVVTVLGMQCDPEKTFVVRKVVDSEA